MCLQPSRPTRAARVRAFIGAIITASPVPRSSQMCLRILSLAQKVAIALFVGGNDSEPVPHAVLFEELLCEVLEVPADTPTFDSKQGGTGWNWKHSAVPHLFDMGISAVTVTLVLSLVTLITSSVSCPANR